MPISDRRELAFDAAAIAAIVASSQHAAQSLGLPRGPPRSVRFAPLSGQVALFYGANAEAVPIASGALGALLVAYCLRSRIRIPRLLDRSVRVDQEAAVLIFSTDYPIAPATAPEQATALSRPLARVAS